MPHRGVGQEDRGPIHRIDRARARGVVDAGGLAAGRFVAMLDLPPHVGVQGFRAKQRTVAPSPGRRSRHRTRPRSICQDAGMIHEFGEDVVLEIDGERPGPSGAGWRGEQFRRTLPRKASASGIAARASAGVAALTQWAEGTSHWRMVNRSGTDGGVDHDLGLNSWDSPGGVLRQVCAGPCLADSPCPVGGERRGPGFSTGGPCPGASRAGPRQRLARAEAGDASPSFAEHDPGSRCSAKPVLGG